MRAQTRVKSYGSGPSWSPRGLTSWIPLSVYIRDTARTERGWSITILYYHLGSMIGVEIRVESETGGTLSRIRSPVSVDAAVDKSQLNKMEGHSTTGSAQKVCFV